jgi:hypothetical protein
MMYHRRSKRGWITDWKEGIMRFDRIIGSAIGAALLSLTLGGGAQAAVITVSATDDIFLAGQTSVPSFPGGAGNLPPSLSVTPGETLHITATGLISFGDGVLPFQTPNGITTYPWNGLPITSTITGYGDVGTLGPYHVAQELLGVFLGPGITPPATPFIIGSADTVVVPAGATTLYLGIPDANGFNGAPGFYGDNLGSFTVDVLGSPSPMPGAGLLSVALIMVMGAATRLRDLIV